MWISLERPVIQYIIVNNSHIINIFINSCTQSYPQPVDKCINCFCLLKFSLLYHNKTKIGISKFNKFKTVDFAGKPFSLFIF